MKSKVGATIAGFAGPALLSSVTDAAPIEQQANRLYGTPLSVINERADAEATLEYQSNRRQLLRLKVPESKVDELNRAVVVLNRITSDESEAAEFRANPEKYFSSRNLSFKVSDSDHNLRLLKLVVDPQFRTAANQQDFHSVIQLLDKNGLSMSIDSEKLKEHFKKSLESNGDKFKSIANKDISEINFGDVGDEIRCDYCAEVNIFYFVNGDVVVLVNVVAAIAVVVALFVIGAENPNESMLFVDEAGVRDTLRVVSDASRIAKFTEIEKHYTKKLLKEQFSAFFRAASEMHMIKGAVNIDELAESAAEYQLAKYSSAK